MMMKRRFLPLALIAFSMACGGGDAPSSEAGEFESPDATPTSDDDGEAFLNVEDPEEFVEAYEGLLEDMLENLREIEDADDARQVAERFEDDVDRLNALGDEMEGENAMALATAYMSRAGRLMELSTELSREVMRIQADPELREAFGTALENYEGGR